MLHIYATVIHPLGTFSGELETTGEPSREDLEDTVQALEQTINRLHLLSLLRSDGSKTCFNEQVLRQSILTFKIVDDEQLEETFR